MTSSCILFCFVLHLLGMKNNKTFNDFMFSKYEKHIESLREEFKNDPDTFSKYYQEYFDWLDALSWDEICDHADLFKSENE